MLIKADARQIFVDLGYEAKACAQLKRETWDDEFLVGRVIFLTTYGTNVDLAKLIDEHGLAETVIAKLANHAKLAATPSKGRVDPMQDMALGETLKLMFNLTHFAKDKTDAFTPAVISIVTLLTTRQPRCPSRQRPRQPSPRLPGRHRRPLPRHSAQRPRRAPPPPP